MFTDSKTRRSVFRSESSLSPNTTPDTVLGRESEVDQIASAVRPLAQGNPPENLFVHGPPGIGKTTCVKHVLDKLEDQTRAKTVYINCWQYNTRPALLAQFLIEVGYPAPRKGKSFDELLAKIRELLNKQRDIAVVLDEFDQLDDAAEIIYDLQQVSKDADHELGLILISNEPTAELELDPRSQSRLDCQTIEFHRYDKDELVDILKQRAEAAFRPGVISDNVLELIARIVADQDGDCRHALNMLLRAGRAADKDHADKVTPKHVRQRSVQPSKNAAPA